MEKEKENRRRYSWCFWNCF